MTDGALVFDDALVTAVDRWLQAEEAAHCPPLDRTELRKGIQALSDLYVARRSGGRLSQRAAEGPAKRAAFATFFAPLHFFTCWAVLQRVATPGGLAGGKVVDLGCGTGAVGAAVARFGGADSVLGIDRTGWSLGAAARTWQHLDVVGRGRRASLPAGMGWPKGGATLTFGWSLNELPENDRVDTLKRVEAGLRKGCGLLVLEPLSRRITPWWEEVAGRLGRLGVAAHQVKVSVELPPLLRDLDRAAGLDHRLLGARALWRPPA